MASGVHDGTFLARRALPVLLLAAGVVLVLLVSWRLAHILLLVFAAVLAAILLRTLASQVARVPFLGPRLGLLIAIFAVIAVLAGASWLMGAQMRMQFGAILERLPKFLDIAEQWLGIADLERIILERTQETLEQASLVRSFAGYSSWAISILAEMLLVLVGAVYFAADPSLYRRGLLQLLPPGRRQEGRETLDALGTALRLWLLGKLAAMLLVGALTGFALWLMGVPSALALGAIAGLLEFVPYVGPIAAAIPALVVAAAERPELALWVAGLYLLVQQLEGNVITPLVQQRAVDLPPAATLFAIVAAGTLLGPLGVLLATPLAVVLFVGVKKLWLRDALEEETSLPGEDG